MVSDALSLRHPDGNSEPDSARIIFDFKSSVRSSGLPTTEPEGLQYSMEILPSSAPQTMSLTDEIIAFYVAGVCVKKFIDLTKNHDCNCSVHLETKDPKFRNTNEIFTRLKAYSTEDDFGALHVPSENFLNLFSGWNDIFTGKIDSLIHTKNIISQLRTQSINHLSVSWFPDDTVCRQKLYSVMDYFFRIRIYYVLKSINQTITDNIDNYRQSGLRYSWVHRGHHRLHTFL